MAGLWCRHLPFVTVPRNAAPKPITYIYPYYENPQFLRQQLEGWLAYPAWLLELLTVIVVDDGSPDQPVADVLGDIATPAWLRLFRIEVDIRWNWLAARNIGAWHAADGWLLLTDIDHVVPVETLTAIVYGDHDPGTAYAFSRREHDGREASPHSASWLMVREMFWTVGGYDERGSGYYGNDGPFRRRVASTARMAVLRDVLVRHEYQGDSSTTRYLRKQPEDAGLKRALSSGKRKVLSFPYHEVTRQAVPA